jgi:5-methyltetrahydropteroyltriglutamate--homocysteine methyltransferase
LNILAAHCGSFPRIGDSRESQQLRVAVEAFQRGEIKERQLELARNEAVRSALEAQAKAGLDAVSDGQVRWDDPVSHFMGKFSGVDIAGLLRYYDTNTYFRQPVVTGAVEPLNELVVSELKLARAISTRPVIARITGPVTLSRLSLLRGGPYRNADQLAAALAPHLAAEVERLASAGAAEIVVEEPALLREPAALPVLADALEVLAARRGSVRLWLFPSFGDAAPLYDQLQKLPVDGLILDLTCSTAAAGAVISSGSSLALGLGLVDARNTGMESPAKLAKLAAGLIRRAHGPIVMLVPSNGLEYLPWEVALRKLAILARVRDLLTGVKEGRTVRSRKRGAKPRRPAHGRVKRPRAGRSSRRAGKNRRTGKR